MSENKQLIRYMPLADDYGEIARIFFVIDETGEEIEGYPQIQNWVNSLYKENKELKEENEQLKQENEFAKLLANHRGEMVTFVNGLIQDIDDELTQKMWYQFKEEMYQEWKKKRGIE